MDSQFQPADSLNSSVPQAELPESTISTDRTSINQPLARSQSILNQISTFSSRFFKALNQAFEENKWLFSITALLLLALLALRILFAILDTINDVPLLPPLLELVGISYSVWFCNRYLLTAANRQELSQTLQALNRQLFGDRPALPGTTTSSLSSNTLPTDNAIGVTDNTISRTASNTASDTVSDTFETGFRISGKTSKGIKKSVTIDKSPEELYQFWHNIENFPHFMNHVESVQLLNPNHSHWIAKLPLTDTTVEWDTEIIQDDAPKMMVWRSLGEGNLESVGSVAFLPANGNGTEVRVTLAYASSNDVTEDGGSNIIENAAAISVENLERQLQEDLTRFKQLMETGDVPMAL